jgi:hypothetical protein
LKTTPPPPPRQENRLKNLGHETAFGFSCINKISNDFRRSVWPTALRYLSPLGPLSVDLQKRGIFNIQIVKVCKHVFDEWWWAHKSTDTKRFQSLDRFNCASLIRRLLYVHCVWRGLTDLPFRRVLGCVTPDQRIVFCLAISTRSFRKKNLYPFILSACRAANRSVNSTNPAPVKSFDFLSWIRRNVLT